MIRTQRTPHTNIVRQGKLLAVDIETSKILSVLPNVEPYAHLEFADGYVMYTAAGHAEGQRT